METKITNNEGVSIDKSCFRNVYKSEQLLPLEMPILNSDCDKFEQILKGKRVEYFMKSIHENHVRYRIISNNIMSNMVYCGIGISCVIDKIDFANVYFITENDVAQMYVASNDKIGECFSGKYKGIKETFLRDEYYSIENDGTIKKHD